MRESIFGVWRTKRGNLEDWALVAKRNGNALNSKQDINLQDLWQSSRSVEAQGSCNRERDAFRTTQLSRGEQEN